MHQSMKEPCQEQVRTKMQANGDEKVPRNKQQQQVSMTLLTADRRQQQISRDEIYDHFECDNVAPDQSAKSSVAQFYTGRNVFITGASGFVGKCLLEKLIRSCPTINNIYILMRPKRGVEIEDRLEALLKSELFSRLRQSPNSEVLLKKIKPIRGDITEPLFGLSTSDIEILSSEVSIVFHSAATVKFVEPLHVATTNNVISVGNLVDLAGRLKGLEALVHVSTAYSNCDRKIVDEILYDAPIEAEKLIEMARWMKANMFEEIAPILVSPRPNTYTFTKAVAEALLVKRSRELIPDVPIAMVRPSIVAGTWKQPLKGWVDNFNGPTGVILSMATGVLQAMPAKKSYCADIVPVDIVANLIICSAYHVKKNTAKPSSDNDDNNQRGKGICIFNCVSGTLNPIYWHEILRYVKDISKQYPMNNPFRDPGFILMSNEYLFSIFNFFNHKCVAHLGDFVLRIIGKKPSLVITCGRLNKMVATLRPFTTNQWLFKCTNVTSLYESLSPIDQEMFNFDVRQVAWPDFISRYYIGSKTFALKDDPNKLSNARHKRNRMKTSSRLVQLFLLIIAYYFLVKGGSMEQHFFELVDSLLPNSLQKYLSPSEWTSSSSSSSSAETSIQEYHTTDPIGQMASSCVGSHQ